MVYDENLDGIFFNVSVVIISPWFCELFFFLVFVLSLIFWDCILSDPKYAWCVCLFCLFWFCSRPALISYNVCLKRLGSKPCFESSSIPKRPASTLPHHLRSPPARWGLCSEAQAGVVINAAPPHPRADFPLRSICCSLPMAWELHFRASHQSRKSLLVTGHTHWLVCPQPLLSNHQSIAFEFIHVCISPGERTARALIHARVSPS